MVISKTAVCGLSWWAVVLLHLSAGGLLQHVQAQEPDELKIDADFPGGNIIVDSIADDEIVLRQDRRDTDRWWFYWYYRVRGAAGRTLTFSFADGNPIGVRGPAVSTDGGVNWTWLGAQAVEKESFTYTFQPSAGEVRFCFTVPYVDSDLQKFFRKCRDNQHVQVAELTKSRKGRKVHMIRFGKLDGDPAHRVLLTARSHACETMASFVLEGIISAVAQDAQHKWLRENVEFLAIPFVDTDGVEAGDQGKSRTPHDHNRDYGGESIYPEVAALRELAPKWGKDKLRIALDLHCPWIRGGRNEAAFMVGPEDEMLARNLERFSSILEALPVEGIPYHAKNNLPFGKEWNSAARSSEGVSMSRWAAKLPGVQWASTLETPYANASGAEVTADSARAFGKRVAAAMAGYLRGAKQDAGSQK